MSNRAPFHRAPRAPKTSLLDLPEGQLREIIAIAACRLHAERVPNRDECLRLGIGVRNFANLWALKHKGLLTFDVNAGDNPKRASVRLTAAAWDELVELGVLVAVRVEVGAAERSVA